MLSQQQTSKGDEARQCLQRDCVITMRSILLSASLAFGAVGSVSVVADILENDYQTVIVRTLDANALRAGLAIVEVVGPCRIVMHCFGIFKGDPLDTFSVKVLLDEGLAAVKGF